MSRCPVELGLVGKIVSQPSVATPKFRRQSKPAAVSRASREKCVRLRTRDATKRRAECRRKSESRAR